MNLSKRRSKHYICLLDSIHWRDDWNHLRCDVSSDTPNGLLANRLLFEILDKLINIIRSIPFIILLSLLALTTRFLVGTTIGAKAALVPLILELFRFCSSNRERTARS